MRFSFTRGHHHLLYSGHCASSSRFFDYQFLLFSYIYIFIFYSSGNTYSYIYIKKKMIFDEIIFNIFSDLLEKKNSAGDLCVREGRRPTFLTGHNKGTLPIERVRTIGQSRIFSYQLIRCYFFFFAFELFRIETVFCIFSGRRSVIKNIIRTTDTIKCR